MEDLLNYFGEGCYVWEIFSSICEILHHAMKAINILFLFLKGMVINVVVCWNGY
jgi:hypothetical protein